jgi:hypothetical protein
MDIGSLLHFYKFTYLGKTCECLFGDVDGVGRWISVVLVGQNTFWVNMFICYKVKDYV